MSAPTLSQIRDAWADNVFAVAGLTAITDKFISYEVEPASQHELAALSYNQEINFFTYVARSRIERQIGGAQLWRYRVDVSYVREIDTTGVNYVSVLDAIETLMNAVISELGDTWDALVDFWSPFRPDYPEVIKSQIADKIVWQVRYSYEAFKKI